MINSGNNNEEQHRTQDKLLFPDMTALLDVIFILLVFLLLTANVLPKALNINLPEEATAKVLKSETTQQITITLFADSNHWGLNEQEFSQWQNFVNAIKAEVKRRRKNTQKPPEIILAGDQEVSLQQLLQVFSWLQQNQLNTAKILIKHSDI